MTVSPLLMGVIGIALILVILWDAFETILVPRRIGRRVRLTRYFYLVSWRIWRAMAGQVRKPSRREGMLGFFGPLSLILLLFCWAAGLIVGFALLDSAVGGRFPTPRDFGLHIYLSGETFFTLGFGDFTPTNTAGRILAVIEAGLGFGFLGTVVGYLPTMYSAFAQREIEISLLDARAGSPPTALEFLRRNRVTGEDQMCDSLLIAWERWSAQLLETHISYPQLAYYRSQHSNQSWLGALITILDSTSLMLARSGPDSAPRAHLTFAMARHALVDITQVFVTHFTPGFAERMTAGDLDAIRAELARNATGTPLDVDFDTRLAELRLSYEPYAQALASYLRFELPPWVLGGSRHDNWRGGPWDRQLHPQKASSLPQRDHF